ncbi:hypothetical protein C2G38_2237367 [Gigaspora rosea]|uniref:Uncharacterized protein n=1 Tax=Gigaspora rosea TaxID=44941 RepID=A0A397TSD9_9GLOM|nr:hypothetical protein C2G38_2237367 [Gigaspora rosea]
MIGGIKIPVDVVVADANSYNAIVGNDLLSKVQAKIDWNKLEMSLTWDVLELDEKIEGDMDEEWTDSEEEFEEEELEEKIYNYSGIEDEEQNYYYVPDVEESSSEESLEIEETLEEKDPFLNLADHMALLKSQLKSELPNTLNAINVTFTVDKDIIFENSNRMDNKSKPTLPLQYTRKEFHMPPLNPTNLPAIVYYNANSSSSSERLVLASATEKR